MLKESCDIRVGTSGWYYEHRKEKFYPKNHLQDWANWLKEQAKKAYSIYMYFNNDTHAHAIKNANQLNALLVD